MHTLGRRVHLAERVQLARTIHTEAHLLHMNAVAQRTVQERLEVVQHQGRTDPSHHQHNLRILMRITVLHLLRRSQVVDTLQQRRRVGVNHNLNHNRNHNRSTS